MIIIKYSLFDNIILLSETYKSGVSHENCLYVQEEFESLVSSPDPEVLHKLGFVDEPLFYPDTNWTNLTTPVIATAVSVLSCTCLNPTLLRYEKPDRKQNYFSCISLQNVQF